MTELETFAKFTLDNGGVWYELEESENYSMYKTQDKFMEKHSYYYSLPVYQIFDKQGNRVFASINYRETYEEYKRLSSELITGGWKS